MRRSLDYSINDSNTDSRGDEEAIGEEPKKDAERRLDVGGARAARLAVKMGAEDEHLQSGIELADAGDGLGDTARLRSDGQRRRKREDEGATHGDNHPSLSNS